MKLHLRYWLLALAVGLLMARMGPIDDGAQVIADDKAEVIQQARVAGKGEGHD